MGSRFRSTAAGSDADPGRLDPASYHRVSAGQRHDQASGGGGNRTRPNRLDPSRPVGGEHNAAGSVGTYRVPLDGTYRVPLDAAVDAINTRFMCRVAKATESDYGKGTQGTSVHCVLYTRLGHTDLTVSRVALGCMSYGDPAAGLHSWTLDEEASQPFFRQAVELGVTFWDTANAYQHGTSEEYVGRAVRRYSKREDVVIATKVFGRMHGGPTGAGLSRAAIHEQCDASLRRLGTDWIDVYFIHRFDDAVSVEETMEALHDLIAAGKVRHLGASSMRAWQFAKPQTAARWSTGGRRSQRCTTRYGLLEREEEREMLPMCADMGVGVVPYSPQGKGRLTRPWGQQTARAAVDEVADHSTYQADQPIVEAVEAVAPHVA